MQSEPRWRFFTDQVMGGLSTGEMVFGQEDGHGFARMTGHVSTANRGGFTQKRQDLTNPPPEGTAGVRLLVRGNAQRYFVHLRGDSARMHWQYHQAGFEVTEVWVEVRLPFAAFVPCCGLQGGVPKPGSLTSVAVVAYGRDHAARIDVREAGFY